MTDINKDCGHCITPEDRCSDESDRNCMNRLHTEEELAAKREEMFEVFRAGYKVGLEDGTNRHGYDADSAFQDWLDGQFGEVTP